jgi:parallel beta-helix repeat protein
MPGSRMAGRLIICVASLALLTGCGSGAPPAPSVSPPSVATIPTPPASPTTSPTAKPTVQVVQSSAEVPPPSGTDDTAAIQAAFDACVAYGPGCTVVLRAGTYRTRQVLADGFHGTVVGAGESATTVEALPRFVVAPSNVMSKPPSPTNSYPFILTFGGGSDVAMSDLTFRVLEHDPVPDGWYDYEDMPHVTFLAGAVYVAGDGRFTHMTFDGGVGTGGALNTDDGTNLDAAVFIDGMLSPARDASLVMTRCTVRHTRLGLVVEGTIGRATVGGSPADANAFLDSGGGYYANLSGATVETSYNRIEDTVGVSDGIFVGTASSIAVPPRVLIAHNRIVVGGTKAGEIAASNRGVFASNQGAGASTSFALTVEDNAISLAGEGANEGVYLQNTAGAVVSGNTFTGRGADAIALVASTAGTLRGNLVSGFAPSARSQIILDSKTTSTRVVCAKPTDRVTDAGAHNTVTGCALAH